MDTPSSNFQTGVDACVLMDLAGHARPAWQSVRYLRGFGARFMVTPTVLHELDHMADDYTNTERQYHANEALNNLGFGHWQDFTLAHLRENQFECVEQVARRLQREMLLPHEERHDHQIICEAAMLGCAYLLTDDTHLLGVPQQRLAAVLQQMGLNAPRIISYQSILA